jgi:DNA-directed RNA polymerase subunit beta'
VLTSDPQNQFEELKDQLLQQISQTFPVKDRAGRFEVRVRDLQVEDRLGVDDIKDQFKSKMEGRSWAAPVVGTIEIVDATTGKVLVSKKNSPIAKIPKLTRHYSYIVGGSEKFVANQWRLRPGVYVKATEKPGEFEAQFQLAKGRSFDLQTGDNHEIYMRLGSRKIPLYSVLTALGVSEDAMKKAWGADAFDASKKKANVERDLKSLYETWRKEPLSDKADPHLEAKAIFEGTRIDPAVAHANVGVRSERVDGDVLFEASKKLLDVAAKRKDPDPIDSLRYKELWTAKDQFVDRIAKAAPDIESRIAKALSKPTVQRRLAAGDTSVLRDVFMPDLIQRPLYHVFTTSLAANGKQTNPVSMLADRSMVTITGPGGIQNPHALSKSNTSLDPSHLGFLDPVFTPESNAGVNTHLTFGVTIKDRKPFVRLYNTKTKQMEDVDAATAATANIVLPDQVRWDKGRPVPVTKTTRMSDRHGHMRDDIAFSSADYVMPSAAQVFAIETNLVPFMQNDSAGRSTMSARHMAQAISVIGREPPKVQVEAGAGKSFESIVGAGFLSHRSKVDGVVKEIKNDEIIVQTKDGSRHSVHLYHHYPTNDPKGQLHSIPLVKAGDRVKAGQIVADNNYTKNGTLALGANLRVAYLANGSNHEDGIVISRSAAERLASEHLYKPSMLVPDTHVIGKKQFLIDKASVYSKDRIDKIGENGVVRPGTKVKPGDPLVLALGEVMLPGTADINAKYKIGKRLRSKYQNSSMIWDGDYEAEVVRAERVGKNIVVHLKTLEPAQIGSKISTRHSAKGIVTEIMDDKEMPHDEKGKPVEMLINPVSVPGRMNPGQLLETAAGKIADKTGRPYVVKNFQGGVDYLKKIQGELKQHGLSDTEALYDPKTGRKLGEVMVGPHYAFQLEHQIDKKTHVRAGGYGSELLQFDAPKIHYDNDTRVPRGGGHTGAQSLGSLGIYAALAAGLKDNLREMQTLKSDQPQAREVWGALANGERIPAPRIPFVFKKFESMLTALGVNVEKTGAEIRLMPRSDAETRALSRGEITKPTRSIRGKDERPEPGGLFDPNVTGGPAGQHWGHIELVEAMPNPVYARAISHTLGIKETEIHKIIEGKAKLPDGSFGGKAFREALAKINIDKEMKATAAALKDPKVKGAQLDKLHFKYRALKNVKDSGKRLDEAWTIKAVPVLPPVFRPQATLPDGTIKNNPLNSLYKRLGMVNESLKKGEGRVPYNNTLDTRAGLYQELSNIFGTTPKGKKALELDMRGTKEDPDKPLPGIIHMLSGDQPKDGFFQDKMIAKKQDYTSRATIVVDPNLSVDEIGLPRKIAIELMRPMVARRLMQARIKPDEAQKMISRKDPVALKALEQEILHRPILMKRDPVLHQYGLVAQRVRLTDDPAIKVSPLILPPLGGDIDGDTVALMVPLTQEAVEEAKRIMPSQRTLSDSSGDVLFSPANESALSLYRMSIPRGRHSAVLKDKDDAEKAFRDNRINLNQQIHIKGLGATTLGRLRIAEVVPEKYRADVLSKLDKPFDRKIQEAILKDVAKNSPKHFVEVVDGMSRLGFKMAYESGHTVGLKDIEPLREHRDKIIADARKEVAALKDPAEAHETWLRATRKIHDVYNEALRGAPTNVSDMAPAPLGSGIKAKREQFQGLIMAPMLVEDHLGAPSKVPITKSFAEGIDLGGYFLQAAGARRGVIQKTDSVREPGYMSKLLVQANIDQPISAQDCGTPHGLAMPITNKDVIDRFLAHDVTLGTHTHRAGTTVTPDMLARAKEKGLDQLVVRSPLKCRMPQGVCSKCMGVHPSGAEYHVGENVGIVAAQALGERAAQLMLKQTHGGGIVSIAEHGVSEFGDVQRLFDAAKRGREDAALAPNNGKIVGVHQSKAGDWVIQFERGKVKTRQKPLPHVKAGADVKRGETLTAGDPNIHDLLATKGLDAVQAHMVDKIGTIYGREGVLRRHVELAVRNATGVVRVSDPGDHSGYVRGDYVQKSVLDEINRNVMKGKEAIKYDPMLLPTKMIPHRRQADWIARLQGERIGQSILTGIQHGHRSDVTGRHPIPALAVGVTVGASPDAKPFGTAHSPGHPPPTR